MGMPEGLRVRLSRARGLTKKGVLNEPMYLPVVLGPFNFTEEALHEEYQTVSAGQFSVPGQGGATARQLRDLSLETLTLDWKARWLIEYKDPQDVRRELNAVLRAKTPVELLAILRWGGGPEELRMLVTLRSLSRELRPGEADTRYYSLALREYRKTVADKKADSRFDNLPTRHRLTADDTLTSLALRYHHTALSWRSIRSANGLSTWGPRTPLWKHAKFKVGDYAVIPVPPPQFAMFTGIGEARGR